jgi:hypothetical protein
MAPPSTAILRLLLLPLLKSVNWCRVCCSLGSTFANTAHSTCNHPHPIYFDDECTIVDMNSIQRCGNDCG